MPGLPEWIGMRTGWAPVLLVAPHGGLSERDLIEPPAGSAPRSNDFHTADLARDLAERLDGTLLANRGLDRNQLDLNRLSEVESRAPWLLEAIAAELERLLARHPAVDVLFVHGWHVVQPKCDIGVGASLGDADGAAEHAARLTVSPAFLRDRLELLRRDCARAGIDASYGERWPAAHRENLVQLFRQSSSRVLGGAAARIAGHARAGRAGATQLELGAPLRWPGPRREAFVRALCAALGERRGAHGRDAVDHDAAYGDAGDRGDAPAPRVERPRPVAAASREDDPPSLHRSPGGAFVQAHDPRSGAAGLGFAAALGAMPDGRLGGRFLLFPGGQRMVLFTGEERRAAGLRVGGLEIACHPDGALELRFRGAALIAPDAARHFRSEAEQTAARIAEVEAEVAFAPLGDRGFGEIAGRVAIDGARFVLRTVGFSGLPPLRSPAATGQATRLTAGFGPALGLAVTLRDGAAASGDRFVPAGRQTLGGGGLGACPAARPPAPFALELGDGRLACRPLNHLVWLRPLGDGRYARITLGVAAFALGGDREGSGFYEHVETVGAAPTAAAAEPAGVAAGEEVA